MKDSYGTYDGRKPEPPYPTEQERHEQESQGMKLEMKQRMEQVDFKKLVAEARASNAKPEDWFFEFAAPLLRAIDALLAERDAALDCEKDNIEINARLRNERNTLLSKLATATEALEYFLTLKTASAADPPILTEIHRAARAALDAIKETANG